VKKVVREEESKTKHVTEWSDGDKRTDKTVTTIEEWIWTFTVEYKLVGFCGADPDKRVVLQGRTGAVEIVTTSDKSPRPETRVVDPIEVNVTWLLRDAAAFKIDRSAKSCRTPRRNADVEAALRAFEALHAGARAWRRTFRAACSRRRRSTSSTWARSTPTACLCRLCR
jgi:hypothetical protein